MGSDKYILDDNGNPVVCDDVIEWGRWFEDNQEKKIIAKSTINGKRVSTVFLGLDHRFGEGSPLIFETMIFEGDGYNDSYCERYFTREEAVRGHEKACKMLEGDSE